jgi:outer membrane receptor for ferrienterochelin and colicins
LGNEDLKAQHSNYFTMSAEYSIGRLTITLAPYYNKVNDMITLVTIPIKNAPGELITKYDPIRVRQYQNMEDAKTYGIDFTVRFQAKDFTAGGSYSYLDTKANQYDSEKDEMHRVTIDGMAHHKGNVYATWNRDFSKSYQLGLGLYGRLSTKRYYQIDGNGKGYQLWRFSTSHQFGKDYRLDAGIDNIFNYCDRTPHGLHLGTTTPGRTVYASLTIRLNQGRKMTNKYKSNLNSNNYDED